MKNRVDFHDLKGKTILELGSGIGFLLRSMFNQLPDCVYIAVDHDINRHKFLKRILEKADMKKNIIFICGDFADLPLGNKSIDVLFDFAGTSNYSFDNKTFLLDIIDKYIKDNSNLLGSYIVFKNFMAKSIIADDKKKNFTLESIKISIQNLGYKMMNEQSSDYIENGGKYENYFIKGEKVFYYIFDGKR